MGKIYLAGPIDNCDDEEANSWRTRVKLLIGEENVLDPMRRDYRGNTMGNAARIVTADLEDIHNSDVILANCWKPGYGTPMEIFYGAAIRLMPVVVVTPDLDPSPWLVYYATYYTNSLDKGVDLAARSLRQNSSPGKPCGV